MDILEGISIVAMDLQDEAEERLVQMVRMDQNDTEQCLVTLDSGADISVLPKSYGNVGQWAPGTESLKMVDAQGKQIAHEGVSRARLRARDANSKAARKRCKWKECGNGAGVRPWSCETSNPMCGTTSSKTMEEAQRKERGGSDQR